MLFRGTIALWLVLASAVAATKAQEYSAAKLDSPVAAGQVSPEIAALLQPTGMKVVKGGSQSVCEIWLAKEWPLAADAMASPELAYPLTTGQLVGVIRYPQKGSDFREQEIPAGVYTLRYSQQPVDGAHLGTSPTRDFLALVPAAKDQDAKTLDYKVLKEISKESTGTAHPGVLFLTRPEEGGGAMSVREDAEKQWVIVRLSGKAKQGGGTKDLPLEIVVVGKVVE